MRTYIFLAIALLLCSGTAMAGTTFSRTIPATPGGEITVEIMAGKLTVTGWDRNEVHIEGELGDDIDDVRIETDGDDIKIEVEIDDRITTWNEGYENLNEGYANLEIFVPADSNLELESVAVGIDVYGIRGEMEIEAVSGNITVSGRSRVIEIDSVSGKIQIQDGADEIEIESISGTVSIAGGLMADVEVKSVSGNIRFDGTLNADGNLSIENVSGDVLVFVPGDISASFELSTFKGNLVSDFVEMEIQKSKFIPSQEASFTTGSGFGAEISVETFSGAIEIKQK